MLFLRLYSDCDAVGALTSPCLRQTALGVWVVVYAAGAPASLIRPLNLGVRMASNSIVTLKYFQF